MTHELLSQRPITEKCLHNGDNLQPISNVRRVVTRRRNQTLEEVFRSHSSSTAQLVQEKPADRPGDLFILRDEIIHIERKVSYRDRLSRRWDMTLYLFPFHRHSGEGHSVWGLGAVYRIIIPPPHLYPCLANKRRIGCEEGLYR